MGAALPPDWSRSGAGEFRMDDAGRVNPYEHLAFPGTGMLRLVVGERLGAIADAQTNRLHAPLPNKHLSVERDTRSATVRARNDVRMFSKLGIRTVRGSLHRLVRPLCRRLPSSSQS